MADLQKQFLLGTLGTEGYAALAKAVARYPDLQEILVPRTILSFIASVQELSYKGSIPGIPNSVIALTKSGGIINDTYYTDLDANPYTMAAHLAILLGAQDESKLAKNVKNIDLTRLGKTIDLIVKSRLLRSVAKTDLPVPHAAPVQHQGPVGHEPPIKPVVPIIKKPKQAKPRPKRASVSATAGLPDLKVSKSDAYVPCELCAQPQFRADGGFYGCLCMRGLAPFVVIKSEPEYYTIQFGPEWSQDAANTLSDLFGE